MHPHLLVFDSGVGALSIIESIRAKLPGLSITYASDNGFYPYGTKPEPALIARVETVLTAAIAACNPDLVVIACNTASTVALPVIRSRFKMPIVGVVPAIKPAAELSRSRVIGLLATPATAQRAYTRELIASFAADCQVISLGSSELVEMAEQKLRGETIAIVDIQAAIAPLLAHPDFARLDTLVLACTHFPLLKAELKTLLPDSVTIVDSGAAIANRVDYLLQQAGFLSQPTATTPTTMPNTTPASNSIFTADTTPVQKLLPALQKRFGGPVAFLTIESTS